MQDFKDIENMEFGLNTSHTSVEEAADRQTEQQYVTELSDDDMTLLSSVHGSLFIHFASSSWFHGDKTGLPKVNVIQPYLLAYRGAFALVRCCAHILGKQWAFVYLLQSHTWIMFYSKNIYCLWLSFSSILLSYYYCCCMSWYCYNAENICCYFARSKHGARYDEWTLACLCHSVKSDWFCKFRLGISFASVTSKSIVILTNAFLKEVLPMLVLLIYILFITMWSKLLINTSFHPLVRHS